MASPTGHGAVAGLLAAGLQRRAGGLKMGATGVRFGRGAAGTRRAASVLAAWMASDAHVSSPTGGR